MIGHGSQEVRKWRTILARSREDDARGLTIWAILPNQEGEMLVPCIELELEAKRILKRCFLFTVFL
jgi:hypothetical protein